MKSPYLLFLPLLLLLAYLGQEKKEDILSLLLKKKTKNLYKKKTIKLTTTTASTPSIPSYSLSLEQYLSAALKTLIKAYKGIEDEEKEK